MPAGVWLWLIWQISSDIKPWEKESILWNYENPASELKRSFVRLWARKSTSAALCLAARNISRATTLFSSSSSPFTFCSRNWCRTSWPQCPHCHCSTPSTCSWTQPWPWQCSQRSGRWSESCSGCPASAVLLAWNSNNHIDIVIVKSCVTIIPGFIQFSMKDSGPWAGVSHVLKLAPIELQSCGT